MMQPIDWRDLYASNRAVIERAGVAMGDLPAGMAVARQPAVPDERTFTVAGQTRRARVHVPAAAEAQTAVPLVCMLHGCTQDSASFAAATLMNDAADRHGFVVVYPQQERGDNPRCCWNWFVPEHQARGRGEPASIAAIVRELMGTASPWAIDPRRVFVAGLSAGGAMAAVMAATYPDLFAAVAVHSGLAYRSAVNVGAALTAMARGSEDPIGGGRGAPAAQGPPPPAGPSNVGPGSAHAPRAPGNMAANRLAAPETGDLDIARPTSTARGRVDGGHAYTHSRWTDRRGVLMHERLEVDGLGHAWSGGVPGGSYTDPRGPDATEAIWRFFTQATAAGT